MYIYLYLLLSIIYTLFLFLFFFFFFLPSSVIYLVYRFARRLEGLNLDALQHHINNRTINPYKTITIKEIYDAQCLGPRIREGVKLLARVFILPLALSPPRPLTSSSPSLYLFFSTSPSPSLFLCVHKKQRFCQRPAVKPHVTLPLSSCLLLLLHFVYSCTLSPSPFLPLGNIKTRVKDRQGCLLGYIYMFLLHAFLFPRNPISIFVYVSLSTMIKTRIGGPSPPLPASVSFLFLPSPSLSLSLSSLVSKSSTRLNQIYIRLLRSNSSAFSLVHPSLPHRTLLLMTNDDVCRVQTLSRRATYTSKSMTVLRRHAMQSRS